MIFLLVVVALIIGVAYHLSRPARNDPDNKPIPSIDPLVKELSDRKRATLIAAAEEKIRFREEAIKCDIDSIIEWLKENPTYAHMTHREEVADHLKCMGFIVIYKGMNYNGKNWEITVP